MFIQKQTAGRENLEELNDDVKHWHGATAKSWFSHIAVEVPGENTSDEEYDKLPE